MADIELIIRIPEEIYKASQIIDVKHEDVVQIPLEVIANGTPLDKIRIEIEEVYEELDGYDPHSLGTFASRIDEIIDKYKESEDKE